MAYERRVNQCGIFPNTAQPEKSDFNGQLALQCAHCSRVTDYWLSGWRKVTKAGGKYLSLSLRPKRIGEHGQTGTASAAKEDDIPW
jgi:hypothetical protein